MSTVNKWKRDRPFVVILLRYFFENVLCRQSFKQNNTFRKQKKLGKVLRGRLGVGNRWTHQLPLHNITDLFNTRVQVVQGEAWPSSAKTTSGRSPQFLKTQFQLAHSLAEGEFVPCLRDAVYVARAVVEQLVSSIQNLAAGRRFSTAVESIAQTLRTLQQSLLAEFLQRHALSLLSSPSQCQLGGGGSEARAPRGTVGHLGGCATRGGRECGRHLRWWNAWSCSPCPSPWPFDTISVNLWTSNDFFGSICTVGVLEGA